MTAPTKTAMRTNQIQMRTQVSWLYSSLRLTRLTRFVLDLATVFLATGFFATTGFLVAGRFAVLAGDFLATGFLALVVAIVFVFLASYADYGATFG